MPELDLTTLDTQNRMRYEFHAKRQDAIAVEIRALSERIDKLQRTVDALADSAAAKVQQSRLFRALCWMRLV